MSAHYQESSKRIGEVLFLVAIFIAIGFFVSYLPKLYSGALYFVGNPRFPMLFAEGFQPNAVPLLPSLFLTVFRLVAGVILGVTLGIGSGVMIDSFGYKIAERFSIAIFLFAPVTPLIWYRLIASLLGYNGTSGTIVIAISTMFVVSIATIFALREFPENYTSILQIHKLSFRRQLIYVTLPFLMPSIVMFVRLCLVISWGTLIHVESSGVRLGLGRIFTETYNSNAIAAAHFCTLVLVIIAILLDFAASIICKRFPRLIRCFYG